MGTQIRKIVENFPELVKLERGSGEQEVIDIRDPQKASQDSLIFVSNAALLKEAQASAAQTWVVQSKLIDQIPQTSAVILSSPNPQLAMALIGKKFFPITKNRQIINGPKIHERAVIASTAKIGEDCLIGPGAVIGERVEIGDRTVIGANAVIEADVKVGADCYLHPLVFIAHSCEIGDRCEIHPCTTVGSEGFGYAQDQAFNHYRITHYGRVVLENDVHLGAGVNIDRGTFSDSRIGAGTKIDNMCHLAHNIQIGKNSLLTGGVMVAGSTTLGSYCVFGGRTTITGHIKVGDKVHVAGLAGITRDVTEPGEYGGFPLQPMKSEMRLRATLKEVPTLVKQVRQILKHLGLDKSSEAHPE